MPSIKLTITKTGLADLAASTAGGKLLLSKVAIFDSKINTPDLSSCTTINALGVTPITLAEAFGADEGDGLFTVCGTDDSPSLYSAKSIAVCYMKGSITSIFGIATSDTPMFSKTANTSIKVLAGFQVSPDLKANVEFSSVLFRTAPATKNRIGTVALGESNNILYPDPIEEQKPVVPTVQAVEESLRLIFGSDIITNHILDVDNISCQKNEFDSLNQKRKTDTLALNSRSAQKMLNTWTWTEPSYGWLTSCKSPLRTRVGDCDTAFRHGLHGNLVADIPSTKSGLSEDLLLQLYTKGKELFISLIFPQESALFSTDMYIYIDDIPYGGSDNTNHFNGGLSIFDPFSTKRQIILGDIVRLNTVKVSDTLECSNVQTPLGEVSYHYDVFNGYSDTTATIVHTDSQGGYYFANYPIGAIALMEIFVSLDPGVSISDLQSSLRYNKTFKTRGLDDGSGDLLMDIRPKLNITPSEPVIVNSENSFKIAINERGEAWRNSARGCDFLKVEFTYNFQSSTDVVYLPRIGTSWNSNVRLLVFESDKFVASSKELTIKKVSYYSLHAPTSFAPQEPSVFQAFPSRVKNNSETTEYTNEFWDSFGKPMTLGSQQETNFLDFSNIRYMRSCEWKIVGLETAAESKLSDPSLSVSWIIAAERIK